MSLTAYLALIGVVVLAYISCWYIYSLARKRLDVADEAWGLAQPVIALAAIVASGQYNLVSLVLFMLSLIWGVRLYSHLYKRHSHSNEDRRYVEMRAKWGKNTSFRSFVSVFLTQGVFMYLLAIASIVGIYYGSDFGAMAGVGLGIWLIGFGFEVTADRQLRDFLSKKPNHGQIMTLGLWRYSRHPNYFGEILMWWGIFIICFAQLPNWLLIISPLTITTLISFVSGIPLAEQSVKNNPHWAKYKQSTSALIPWFKLKSDD